MWGWGVMNSTAIKEAAAVGFPRDKFIGVWWSGNEPDVIPAGKAAVGYKSLQFNSVGSDFPVHGEIKKPCTAATRPVPPILPTRLAKSPTTVACRAPSS